MLKDLNFHMPKSSTSNANKAPERNSIGSYRKNLLQSIENNTYLSAVDAISAIYHQQIKTIQRSETFPNIVSID